MNAYGEKYSGTNVTSKMDRLNAMKDSLTPWEQNFIASIGEGYKKFGSLTAGQFGALQKINDRYNAENIQKREDWRKNFTPDMRARMIIMAHYYEANPPYFHDLAEQVLSDPEYIPTEKAYKAMCENKYAQKVIETTNSAPQFPIGSMVMVRNSRNVGNGTSRSVYQFRGQPVVVIDHPGPVTNSANGARPVRVLPVGHTEPLLTEERWLKKLPKKLS